MPAYDKLAFFVGNWQGIPGGTILERSLIALIKLINLNKFIIQWD
jgi:hypothetical protein